MSDADLFPSQAEIILEKCFTGRQAPDFNDFDAVLNCVSRMDSVKKLQYRDFQYMINTDDAIEVAPGIKFELVNREQQADPKTGMMQKITFRIYSDDHGIKELKEYVRKCRQEYESQRNNKLGNEVFFFDQITTKDSAKSTALSFDKKKFETNRDFDNVFFEEKTIVEGRVKHFMGNKQWYAKRGIPYTLGFMFHGPPGCGKCQKLGTPVMKYDGTVVPIENIREGDQLMGDGSQPRTVLSTTRGCDTLYRIKQSKGDDYTVNSVHVLSLKLSIPFIEVWSAKDMRYKLQWYENFEARQKSFTVQNPDKAKKYKSNYATKEMAHTALEAYKQALLDTGAVNRKGDVCDISVQDYLKKPTAWRHAFKGFKRGLVDHWPHQQVDLDPYLMGYWIGDGTSCRSEITSQDATVLKYFATETPKMKCYLQFGGTMRYRINGSGVKGKNSFMNALNAYELIDNKHVPSVYKYTDVDTRRQLLAGFLDADGHLYGGNCFEYSQKSRQVFDDIAFVARSLGLMVSECKTKEVNGVEYYRGTIYGHGVELLPTKIPRKRAQPYAHNKDPLVYEIEVVREDEGEYAGYTLDGNGRYCMGDFTVTHNTSTIKAIANITGRHIINVRLSDVHTNTQLKNLFYNPVVQVVNPETGLLEKFVVPTHQRLYVIEDIDCMTDLIKKRGPQDSDAEDEPVKRAEPKKAKEKKKAKDAHARLQAEKELDSDEELERWRDEALREEKADMRKEADEEEQSDRITKDSMFNILDGTLEIPDRMLCITTNFPDEIDEALIRPGRIDMIVNFKKATRRVICEQFNSFYDAEQPFPESDFDKIKDYKVSQAVVNQVMFKNFFGPKAAIEELVTLSNKRKPYTKKKKDKGDDE
jgi:hypothetical protein